MERIKICIPSYNRADSVSTISNLKGINGEFFIFVNNEAEKEMYEKYNDCEIIVSGKEGITKNRNFILDYFGNGTKLVTLCDDVDGIYKADYENKKVVKMSIAGINELLFIGFDLCEKNNTKLWGVYPIPNHFFMSDKISYKHFIIGTFSGVIVSGIRHDEKLVLKEDYDFTIKHVLKYGKVIRLDNYAVKAKHYSNKGGCVDYRTSENELKSIEILKNSYPNIVFDNPKRENEILLRFSKVMGGMKEFLS